MVQEPERLRTLFVAKEAASHWTQLAGLLTRQIAEQGLPYRVVVEGDGPTGCTQNAVLGSGSGSGSGDGTTTREDDASALSGLGSGQQRESASASAAAEPTTTVVGECAEGTAPGCSDAADATDQGHAPTTKVATTVDWLVTLGRCLTPEVFGRIKPERVVVAHAGIPSTLAGIPNVPPIFNVHHNAQSTGEVAILLLLALQRRVIVADRGCRNGDWSPKKALAHPNAGCSSTAYNSTVVVLGYGAVGRYICRVLRALGSTVIAVRRHGVRGGEPSDDATAVHPTSDLPTLLPRATALVIAAPLTSETRGLLDSAALAALRDNASVVNVGRAEVVDEDAIWSEVESGRLGFASDVWWREGELKAATERGEPFWGSVHPFHTRDNVVLTPHYAGGVGLDGIEEARATAVLATIQQAEAGVRKPCDLSAGY
jgi:phosphoglycerate dehydrogenase-like enzyme